MIYLGSDHLPGKELFIRFTAHAFHKLLSIYVFSYFPFGFEGRVWDLIVSVPDHSLSFFFAFATPGLKSDYKSGTLPMRSWLPPLDGPKVNITRTPWRIFFLFCQRKQCKQIVTQQVLQTRANLHIYVKIHTCVNFVHVNDVKYGSPLSAQHHLYKQLNKYYSIGLQETN